MFAFRLARIHNGWTCPAERHQEGSGRAHFLAISMRQRTPAMTPFPLQTRDKDAKQTAQDPSELRVGHVYLDVRRRRVLCLNQAARDLYADGVPLVPADLESRPLQDVQGEPVTSKQLPLVIAW